MPNQLAEHLHCSKTRLATFIRAAGVKRRVRYVAGDNQPVYYPFTTQETEAILRAAWTAKGRTHARKMGIR